MGIGDDPTYFNASPRPFSIEVENKTTEKKNKTIKEVFRQEEREESLSLDDLFTWRIQAAWRLVRALCLLRDQVAFDETLAEATTIKNGVTAWINPTTHTNAQCDRDYSLSLIADTVRRSATVPDTLKIQQFNESTQQFTPLNGFALLPPPVPIKWINKDGDVSQDYDPYKDMLLMAYIRTMSQLCDRLNIYDGWEKDADGGRLGMIGLLNPELCRVAFPSPLEIVSWESTMIEETIQLLSYRGDIGTDKLIKAYYGLTPQEITGLLAVSKEVLVRRSMFDVEAERAVMIRRLDVIAGFANEAMDHATELKSLKQIALLKGLTTTKPDSENDIFTRAIQSLSNDRRPIANQAPVVGRIEQD